jgi:uncharacterized membrane protein
MEKKYFLLSGAENNKLVKIIQIIFGVVCFAVAIFWLIFNVKSLRADSTLWITIIFLTGFGFYMIWSGLGQATKFIEISSDKIRLKRNILFPPIGISASEIVKIELYPFNLILFLKSEKKILLRFGTTYQETSENIKDEILSFAGSNSIGCEFIEEKL